MSWLDPVRRAPAAVTDLLVAAVVAVPTVMDAWWNEAGTRQADWLTYLLAAISIIALVFRRRWPFLAALTCGGALTAWYLIGHHGELLNLPTMVALYTIAVQTDRRTTVLTGIVAATWSGLLGFTSSDPIGARGGSPILEMIWPLVPLAFGEATRARRELIARGEVDREREARRRVEAERVRIAREFHDVVAHTIAAVSVQIGVAVAAFESKPETARTALLQARASTREALRELRAIVAFLRDPAGDDATAPVPRLSQIDELALTARASGLSVVVDSDVDGRELPASVEVAAYRIVQEALTNVIRHSDARSVAVHIRCLPEGLEVEVTDDGTSFRDGATPPAATAGYGLLGMTERAGAVGGHIEHGPTSGGGFRIHAVLPATQP